MNGLEYANQNRPMTLVFEKPVIAQCQQLQIADMEEALRVTRNAINVGRRSAIEIRQRAAAYVAHMRRVMEINEIAAEYGWTDPVFQPMAPRPFREERHWQERGMAWKPF